MKVVRKATAAVVGKTVQTNVPNLMFFRVGRTGRVGLNGIQPCTLPLGVRISRAFDGEYLVVDHRQAKKICN